MQQQRRATGAAVQSGRLHALGWLCVGLAYAALLVRLSRGGPLVYRFFNADALYLPALLRDLLAGGRWADWQLPGAPFYFPDMPLYFALLGLSGRFEVATLAYGLLQYAALLWAIGQVLRIALRLERPPAAVLFGGGAALLALASGHFDFLVFALLPNFHTSAIVFGFAALVWLRRSEESGDRRALGLLLAGCLLLAASDRMVFVNALLPAAGTLLLFGRGRRRLLRVAAMAACAALGLGLYGLDVGLLHEAPIVAAASPRRFRFETLGQTFADVPTLPVAIAVALAVHLALLFGRRFDRWASVYLGVGHAGLLVATPLLANKGDLLVHQRFFVGIWLLGLLGAVPVARAALGAAERPLAKAPLAVLAGLAVGAPLLLGAAFLRLPRQPEFDGWRFYPPITRCVDAHAAGRAPQPVTGLADYWFARMVQLTSREDVLLLPVTRNLEPATLVAGGEGFREARRRGGFDLVLRWRERSAAVREKLPRPDRRLPCEDIPNPKEGRPPIERVELWIYDEPVPLPWRERGASAERISAPVRRRVTRPSSKNSSVGMARTS